MSKTRNQLALRALSILRIVEAGNEAESEDYQIADRDIDGLIASLDRRGIFTSVDLSRIPDEAFLYLARILAARICPEFGATNVSALLSATGANSAEEVIKISENNLRALNIDDNDDDPIPALYY